MLQNLFSVLVDGVLFWGFCGLERLVLFIHFDVGDVLELKMLILFLIGLLVEGHGKVGDVLAEDALFHAFDFFIYVDV
jgi:hypothetical protein